MRVVVLGRNGVGSRYHYITGYHGPGCIWFDIVFFSIGIISYDRGYNMIYKYNYLGYNLLRGVSPHANYTDRAAAAGRRS